MTLVWLLLGLLVLWLAVIVVRALQFKPYPMEKTEAENFPVDEKRALERFQDMIRLKTVSYPDEKLEDPQRYNTVYAKTNGSAATPTAGLHFTPELLERIRRKGVDIVPVLLHVGLGTFRPVKVKDVSEHVMHTEYYEVTQDAADRLNAVRAHGGHIVCTGTTSVRTLETVATEDGVVHPGSGFTQIFITPGVKIKAVDALITNFHLPQSTLLMLISALMGRENALDVYRQAVEERYRFFSFGDAMMITGKPQKDI